MSDRASLGHPAKPTAIAALPQTPGVFTRGRFDALRRETDLFTDVFAQVSDVDRHVDGRLTFGTFVTGNFFQVLGVSAVMGRTLTPADDEPSAGEPVMVLSDRGWNRLFARDPAVIGRRLLLNGFTFEIVGVMPRGFRGLTVTPDDYWAPLSRLDRVRPIHRGRDANVGVDIIGRLKPGISRPAAMAQHANWDAGHSSGTTLDRAASNVTLAPRRGTVEQPLEVVPITVPLFFAFGLILLIGCANVANLLLARGNSGGDGVRGDGARDVAELRCDRPGHPSRPRAAAVRNGACRRTAPRIPNVYGDRSRLGRRRAPDRTVR